MAMGLARELGLGVYDVLFPPICSVCGEGLSERSDVLCDICRSSFQAIGRAVCPTCGAPCERQGAQRCRHCPPQPVFFESARAAFRYVGDFPEVFRAFKYRHAYQLGLPLARTMFMAHREFYGERFELDLLVPVPLHWWRKMQRGYNQAQVLADEIARLTGLPCAPKAAARVRRTSRQAFLPRDHRRADNVRGAFEVPLPERIRGMRVGLVDDVMTSGATVNECARTLVEAGAEEVRVIALARA